MCQLPYFPINTLQKPPDIISMNEVLLIRFRSDDTMAFKGFSASYVAVDPFDSEEPESSEMATPFPGYLKSVYVTKQDNTDNDSDEDETFYNEYDNYNAIKENRKNNKKNNEPSENGLID